MQLGWYSVNNMQTENKIPVLGYSAGNFTFSVMIYAATMYYTYFLTDVIELAPLAIIGSFLLVLRVADAVMAFFAGNAIQVMHFKWGKYTSWLLIAPPLILVSLVLTFINVKLPIAWKMSFYFIFYLIAHLGISFVMTAHLALLPEIATSDSKKTLLATRYNQAGSIGRIVMSVSFLWLVTHLGRGEESSGFLYTILLYSSLMVCGYYVSYFCCRKYDIGPGTVKQNKVGFRANVVDAFSDVNLRRLCWAELFKGIALVLPIGVSIYYFKYVVGKFELYSLYLILLNAAVYIGNYFVVHLSSRFNRRDVYYIGLAIYAIGLTVAFLFSWNVVVFIIAMIIASAGTAFVNAISLLMFTDVAESIKESKEKDLKGFIISLMPSLGKFGLAISSFVSLAGLKLVGYIPNVTTTTATKAGIVGMNTLLPLLFLIPVVVFLSRYSLDRNSSMTISRKEQIPINVAD